MRLQSRFVILLGVSVFIIFTILLSSCAAFEDPSKRATENAEITALWSEVDAINTQAPTVQAMRQTAENANLFATQLAQANADLAAARSTNVALQNNPGAAIISTIPPSNANGQPTALGGGVPAGQGPSPVPAAQFVQTTTTTGTNDDGCSIDNQNVFTTDTSILYFVTTALNLSSNTSFTLQITTSGQVLMTDQDFWISDDEYNNICVWYGIDQDTIAFNPGTYTVQLLVNNVISADATFVISPSGDTTGEDQMDDS